MTRHDLADRDERGAVRLLCVAAIMIGSAVVGAVFARNDSAPVAALVGLFAGRALWGAANQRIELASRLRDGDAVGEP